MGDRRHIGPVITLSCGQECYDMGEIFDKCPIAENRFTSCLLLII